MNTRTFVAISIVVTAPALGAQKAPDITPYLIADRAAEVALARTAAPSAPVPERRTNASRVSRSARTSRRRLPHIPGAACSAGVPSDQVRIGM